MITLGSLKFPCKDIISYNMAIIGSTQSGKTETTKKIIPQLDGQVIVLDVEDQYSKVVKHQIKRQPADSRQATWLGQHLAEKPKLNYVYNAKIKDTQVAHIEASNLLSSYWENFGAKKAFVVAEEAYFFMPEKGVPRVGKSSDVNYWLYTMQTRGGNRHLGTIIITQRPAQTSKYILTQCGRWLIFKLNTPWDLQFLKDFGMKDYVNEVKNFSPGQCLTVGFGPDPKIIQIPK